MVFRDELTEPFSLRFMARPRLPLIVSEWSPCGIAGERVNHYLVKGRNSDIWWTDHISPSLRDFLARARSAAKALALPIRDRYAYLTFDFGRVASEASLRTPGWHIDGMQGDEVRVKKPVDFHCFWFDSLPTVYCPSAIDLAGLDTSRHNVFTAIERAVQRGNLPELNMAPLALNLISGYQPHRAAIASRPRARRFVRVSFTHTPVTSMRATLNPSAIYDHPTHATSGAVPAHLS